MLFVVLALLAACTLHVEMDMRSVPAYMAPEHTDAGATSLFYYGGGTGLTVGDGGISSLSIAAAGCSPSSDAGNCESPCAMPLVDCEPWSAMRYDGCRWGCKDIVQ